MTRYLFVGPSLPDAAALAGPGVHVLPPIAAGDLLRLRLAAGDTVGIVDGYFHQRPAVRHKEILAVLTDKVRVLGAASIGALRAAELDRYGMEGVGEIYRAYRDGELEADDEVAVVHGTEDDGYRPLSEPLVNIRATLAAAQLNGVLDGATRERLIHAMATLPYARRHYEQLVATATELGMAESDRHALREFCSRHPVDRKRSDALELLRVLRDEPWTQPEPDFQLSRTVYLQGWQLEAGGDLDVLRVCQVFAADFAQFYGDWAIDQIADECASQCDRYADDAGGAVRSPTDVAVAHGRHIGLYPELTSTANFDFLQAWLTPAEQGLDTVDRLRGFLARSHARRPGIRDIEGLTAAVLASRAVADARKLVHAAKIVNQRIVQDEPTFDLRQLSGRRIAEWCSRHWGSTMATIEPTVLSRGIDSPAALISIAQPYYLAARYNPGLARFRMSDHEDSPGVSRLTTAVEVS